MMHKYSILSLFTGAGGLDYSFESTERFVTRLALEYQPEFCQTLRSNQSRGYLSDAVILEKDISTAEPEKVCWEIAPNWRPDCIIGGPPCQSFSSMGKRKGLLDPRGEMIFVFLNWVKVLRPRLFLMENVPLLSSVDRGRIREMLTDGFRRIGYSVSQDILMAADYGAATLRKRFFIIGSLDAAFTFPPVSHANKDSQLPQMTSLPYLSVSEVLESLPSPKSKWPGEPNGHFLISHSSQVTERFASIRPGGYDHVRKRSRLRPDYPSPSLVAGNLSGIRSHIHPTEPRELTNRESARIQGFPDDFEFAGNHAAMGLQIANSVPIALGKALASAIAEHLAR